MHRRHSPCTGNKRHVKRVLAEQVVHHLNCRFIVLFIAGQVVGIQQPHALICSHRIGAPDIIIITYHDTETRFSPVDESIGSRNNIFLRHFRIATKFRRMSRLSIRRKSSHIRPRRNIFRRTRFAIEHIACRNKKFRTCKQFFITRIPIFIRSRRYTFRICRKILIRIINTPSISIFCRLQALCCIFLIERFIDTSRHGHYCSKVKRSRSTLANGIKIIDILCRHNVAREFKRSQLMVNTAILSLHRQHPI